ncbi:MAG: four helix bundle protein [Thermodesulfovibrionales bacterium]
MTYKDLRVWQKADELAFEIYRMTKKFPKDEMYGITSQLRRAALSVPTNIVEGYARKGDKELSRFVSISIGSLAEVEYLLTFARRLGYFTDRDYIIADALRSETGSLLWTFYKKVLAS